MTNGSTFTGVPNTDKGNKVSDLQLGDSSPVGGNQDLNVEWSYSYQVVQKPGG